MVSKLNQNEEKKILDFISFLKSCSNNYYKITEIFHFAEKQGYHFTPTHFYSPIPTVYQLDQNVFDVKQKMHFDWNEKSQLELLEKLKNFSSEYEKLIQEKKFDDKNGAFEWHDAPIYYSIIRHFKPAKIVEVGVGYSTIIGALAAEKNDQTQITAIDPFLAQDLKKKLPKQVSFIEKPVQEIPLSFFKELQENDILFIDDSHVSKIGSDVNFLFLDVLPELNPGVIIHIHDIFLPKQYPKEWILEDHRRFWNEQYLLEAFMIGNSKFEVMIANHFLGYKHPEKLQNFYKTDPPISGGGSFWIRKKF